MYRHSYFRKGDVVISVIVEDVEDIADMPIGRNAIIVEDIEDKTLTSK